MEKLLGFETTNSYMTVTINQTTTVLSEKQALIMAIKMLEEELRSLI